MTASHGKTMKAVVWEGRPYHMSVKEIPKPTIKHPSDAIVKITTAAICGSDLHIYHGIGGATTPSWVMGHEGVGIVVEVGDGVERVKVGDRVIIPDLIPDDPDTATDGAAGYGFGNILGFGYLGGCQSEYVRLPGADDFAVVLPEGSEKDEDWVLLSDIWPTAWQAVTWSGFQAGDSVAVFGCGPVGLLGQYSALLRGASKVYAIDHVDERLKKAASIGAIPIDLKKGDPAPQILALEPQGVNRSLDLCGYECVNPKLEKQENYILNQAVLVTAPNGGIGVIGVYTGGPPSAGSPELSPKLNFINFDIGTFWGKGLSLRGGGVFIQELQPVLLGLIRSGRADPGFVIDHVASIDEAPETYRAFDEKKFIKSVIKFT